MAQSFRCEYCGSSLSSDEQNCPYCGAPNPHYLPGASIAPAESWERPRTISELQAYCASRGMPLEKMRFFIGEDYREPRAFGIYRDGSDFVVYKNKADGSRAIRYRGPDEAFAVGELYDKLMAEHAIRADLRRSRASSSGPARGGARSGGRLRNNLLRNVILPLVILFALSSVFTAVSNRISHRNDGYYRVGEDLFYRYGASWFMDSLYSDDWYEVEDFPYEDYREYYQGNEYDDSWGGSSFTDSQAWSDLQDSGSDYDGGDYDYGDWDAGDTDWDSDW